VRFNGAVCGPAYADLLGEIGTACESDSAAEWLATWLADLLARSRLATTLTAARVAAPDTATLAAQAAAQWTAGFNPRPVTAADLARLYEAAR
jgi:alcohol dehydrogenase class IV